MAFDITLLPVHANTTAPGLDGKLLFGPDQTLIRLLP